MLPPIPSGWRKQLEAEVAKPYFRKLEQFLAKDRKKFEIYPPEEDTFRALELTPYDEVKVLLLGQDPYPGPNQGHGLCFSVRRNIPIPASLKNIYKELESDIHGFRRPNNGYLVSWARQGMLMLNAVLTVRAHQPNSHKGQGWEEFTDAIISKVAAKTDRVVFVLWGNYAREKKKLLKDKPQHAIVEAGHPSPLSAKYFLGQKSFSQINASLREVHKAEIDWQIPDV